MRFIITAALLAVAAPVTAQHDMSSMKGMHGEDAMHAEKGDGKLPAGWHARLDDSKASISDMKFHKVGNALHFMTGPATIVWNNANRAAGSFIVSGDFEQMKLPAHPEAFGIVFAGENLDKDNQSYLYFLVRHDGKFTIRHRAGADVHGIVEWSSTPAVAKPDASGHSVNRLSIDAGADMIRYMINGRQVAAFPRDKPMGANGLVGVRVNHNLDVHVNNFKVTRK
jgi:hypothetical protein